MQWAYEGQVWLGLVIFVVNSRSGDNGPVAVQEWIPASRLRPAAPGPERRSRKPPRQSLRWKIHSKCESLCVGS